jgi:hypothetical protein
MNDSGEPAQALTKLIEEELLPDSRPRSIEAADPL